MPKFPDILLNNNPNAPSLDLNNLQVKGVGIFADAAARDALDSNLHTEGYLAIMKDTDSPFIYTGGTWTDAANWVEVKGVWEEVAYTGQTAIKYENGVVGIKDSAVTYPTSGNLWSKVRNFPIDKTASGSSYQADALMHLHEGRIVFTTENTSTEFTALTITNAFHSAAYSMSIGMESNYGTINGQSGVRIKPSGVSMMEFGYSSSGSTAQQITVSNNLPVQNASTNKTGMNMGNSVLMLGTSGSGTGGEILFYGHTANVFSAIKPRGFYATNSGVSIASPRSGYFAHFAASDGNTSGSFGYLGINVDNPQASGPAFEVSSSYAKFNNGLHIGDITTTGYAFPTATGTLDQVLKVDANGDLVFGTDNAGLWTADTNGINYQAGNVGIGKNSDSSDALDVLGTARIENSQGTIRIDGNSGNPSGAHILSVAIGGSINAGTAGGRNVSIGSNLTPTSSNGVLIGYNKSGGGTQIGSNYPIVIGAGGTAGGSSIGIGATTNQSYSFVAGSGASVIGTGGTAIGHAAKTGGGVSIGMYTGRDNASTATTNVMLGARAGWRAAKSADYDDTIGIGYQALGAITTGDDNVAIGHQAGYNVTDAYENVIIGSGAASSLISGYRNILIGNSITTSATHNNAIAIGDTVTAVGNTIMIGKGITGTGNSIIIGENYTATSTNELHIKWSTASKVCLGCISAGAGGAAVQGTAGDYSVAIGSGSDASSPGHVTIGHNAGSGGVAIGIYASNANSGGANVVLGQEAGYQSGLTRNYSHNVIVGNHASKLITTGANNVSIGSQAGYSIGTGDGNVMIGYQAGYNLTSADNVIIGSEAGYNLSTGTANTFVGRESGNDMTTGSGNTLMGYQAGDAHAGGQNNTAVGRESMGGGSVGSANTHIGSYTGQFANGSNNTYLGSNAGSSAFVDYAVSVGTESMRQCFTYGDYGVAIGYKAGYSFDGDSSIAIGREAGYDLGASSVAIGSFAGRSATGLNNVLIGHQAGQNGGAGTGNTKIGYDSGKHNTDGNNTFIGLSAGTNTFSNAATTGGFNVAIGNLALGKLDGATNNVAIGTSALATVVDGVGNIGIGDVVFNAAADSTNNIAIGNRAWGYNTASLGSANNNIAIGDHAAARWQGGDNNIILGNFSGDTIDSGTGNLILGTGYNTATSSRSGLSTMDDTIVISSLRTGLGATFSIPTVEGSFGTNQNWSNSSAESPRWDMSNPRKVWRGTNGSFTYTQGLVYVYEYNSGTGEYWRISGGDAAANGTNMLGIALGTNRSSGFLISGEYNGSPAPGGLTMIGTNAGQPVYLVAEIAGFPGAYGRLSLTPPTASGQIVRIVGYVMATSKLYFNPSNEWVEI